MKDYKKILEDIANIINTAEKSDIGFANICTYIGEKCPELGESEDEKIRKHLICLFKEDYGENSSARFAGIKVKDILAWLEKQGEQKPVIGIDIPFGAKDSELQEVSYHIPEGFHAEIEGNKVIIKKGEQKPTDKVEPMWNLSDTRTWLYIVDDVLTKCRGIGNYLDDPICRRIAETMKEEWSKKIEQKTITLEKFQRFFEKRAKQYEIELPNRSYDIHAFCEELYNILSEQKSTVPAEWSEEDESKLKSILFHIEDVENKYVINWLKSLKDRYAWKPSDEQMKAIEYASNSFSDTDRGNYYSGVLEDLYEQLKKLKG